MKPIAILIMACLPLATASADTVILSFPELAGGYEADPYTPPNPGYPQMRSLDFTIPAHVTAIDQLELVVSGDWIEGEITCNDGSGPEVSPFYVGLSLLLTSSAFPGDWFHADLEEARAMATHDPRFKALAVGLEADTLGGRLDAINAFFDRISAAELAGLTLPPNLSQLRSIYLSSRS